MAAPIDLRNDFDSVSLRRLAKRTRDATQSRRRLRWWQQDGCVADRRRRSADHSRLGAALQRPRTGRAGHGKSPGAPSKLNADHRRALAEVVEAGPVPAVDGVVRWRRKDLARWLLEIRHLARRDHGRARVEGARLRQDLGAAAPLRAKRAGRRGFKKNFPAELAKIRARLPKGVEIELWWQDEARIGQKNKLTRR